MRRLCCGSSCPTWISLQTLSRGDFPDAESCRDHFAVTVDLSSLFIVFLAYCASLWNGTPDVFPWKESTGLCMCILSFGHLTELFGWGRGHAHTSPHSVVLIATSDTVGHYQLAAVALCRWNVNDIRIRQCFHGNNTAVVFGHFIVFHKSLERTEHLF